MVIRTGDLDGAPGGQGAPDPRTPDPASSRPLAPLRPDRVQAAAEGYPFTTPPRLGRGD